MNNSPEISIIIPVWHHNGDNGEKLRKSFDCCINQTMNNIEIIAVNDNSPNPLDTQIMKQYEMEYPQNFRCIYLSENIRQGGARNKGISIAKGNYLMFLDDDDTMELTACQQLYEAAISENADLVYCDYWINGTYAQRTVLPEHVFGDRVCFWMAPWALLVSTELVRNNGLYFYEIPYYEDNQTIFWYVLAKKITTVKNALVHYSHGFYLDGNSVSTTQNFVIFSSYAVMANLFLEQLDSMRRQGCLNDDNENLSNLLFKNACLYFALNLLSFGFKGYKQIAEDFYSLYSRIPFSGVFAKRLLSYECLQYLDEIIHSGEYKSEEAYQKLKKWFLAQGIWRYLPRVKEMYKYLQDIHKERICVWGGGLNGAFISSCLSELQISFVITDINKNIHGRIMPGNVSVQPWERIAASVDTIIVCNDLYLEAVRKTVGTQYVIFAFRSYIDSGVNTEEFLTFI